MDKNTLEANNARPCKCGGQLGSDGKNDPANAVDEGTVENYFRVAAMLLALHAMAQAERRA